MEHNICIGVRDTTQTAEARRNAAQLAARLGFDETETGNLGLVVTEAAKNLLKHAGGGDLILRGIDEGGAAIVEMLAIDSGPGIQDVARSFEDGYSTAGTPGTGLGAISRLSSMHDIYTRPREGTALLAQVARRGPHSRAMPHQGNRFRVGVVSVPHPAEPVCGDAWSFAESQGLGGRVLVADGLGHGLLAADAARMAVRVAGEHREESGVLLMERIHLALRPTRGAAVAIADLDLPSGQVRFTGLGNIAGTIVSPDGAVRHLVSHPGTAGHEVRKIAEFTYGWEPGSTLIMHSDGLSTHWSLERYPGLLSRHPSLAAAVLYRDFNRRRDDVTVVVVQENALQEAA